MPIKPKSTKKKPAPLAGQKIGVKGKAVPLSEDERKYHEEWTRDDCIAELQRIAKKDPDKFITRNYFRSHSSISEATWNRYFGKFAEFKRAAGVTLSRHAQKLELAIGKHSSTDEYMALDVEKRQYEGVYLREEKSKWATMLIGSDIHDIECDLFWRRVFVDAARRVQPDIIVLNGDLFDLTEFSKYTQDPRDFKLIERIQWVHTFLADLRAASPNSQIDLIEGNHEFRLFRHLAEQTPAMKVVLSDLHGMTIDGLLGLNRFQVNLHAKASLKAWTETDISKEIEKQNWMKYYDAVIAHHFPQGRAMGWPGWHGHHHKHTVWPGYNPTHGAFEWHQLGAGHKRSASYCDGERWGNGFMLAHVNKASKHTQFEYVEVRNFCMFGGKLYERTGAEKVLNADIVLE